MEYRDGESGYAEITIAVAGVADITASVISGVTEGEAYCAAQTVTVADENLDSVKVNEAPVALDASGKFTLSPAAGKQTVTATDKAGNATSVTVTLNDGHICEWQTENGQYWQKCKVCGEETAKQHTKSRTTELAVRLGLFAYGVRRCPAPLFRTWPFAAQGWQSVP